MKTKLRNQKGFTLIEIIAVLVILGILAAVAVPKYVDMQGEARGKALQGAIAALQSTANMDYAKGLLNGLYSGTNGPASQTGVQVGDFTGSITVTNAQVAVTVTNGPSGWDQYANTYNASASFNIR